MSNRCVVSVTTAPVCPVNAAVVQLKTFDSKNKKASFDRMFEEFMAEPSGMTRSSIAPFDSSSRSVQNPVGSNFTCWMFIGCDSCIRFCRQPSTCSLVFAFVLEQREGKKMHSALLLFYYWQGCFLLFLDSSCTRQK